MRKLIGIVTNNRSEMIWSDRRDSGSDTSRPRCIIGAVTMKMTSMTSITSTRGTTLISDSSVPTRGPRRPRRPPPPPCA